jgi:hypothetical protein
VSRGSVSFDPEALAMTSWHMTLVGPAIASVIATLMFFALSQFVLWQRLLRCGAGLAKSADKQNVWSSPPVLSKTLKTKRRDITDSSWGPSVSPAVRRPQCWSLTDSEGDSDASSPARPSGGNASQSVCVNLADAMDW